MTSLTPRQKEAIKFILAYQCHHGISPNYREIAVAIGTTSTSQVTYAMDALVRAGFIKRGSKARSIELLPSENHHAPDCVCGACASARYLKRLKLVEALKVPPPPGLTIKLRGLRPAKVSTQSRVQAAK